MGLGPASAVITLSESSYQSLHRLIGDLARHQHESTRVAVAGAETVGRRGRVAMGAGLALAVVLSVLATCWCARLIATPLRQAVAVLKTMAAGDFTFTLALGSRDEVGQAAAAINHVAGAMRGTLGKVGAAASQVAQAAGQLSATAVELSSSTQEQASSLEETAASLEEITATIKQSADNARQAGQLVGGARDAAARGGAVAGSAAEAMEEISQASRKIEAIITTVDEIAFQTNLLALNAAVEAARAGEQGRGFAVVAAEVRNLAQRAATAARKIKGLIRDSVSKVDAGAALVTRSGGTLAGIVVSVKHVTEIIGEMATASAEQATGIDRLNRTVTQIDHAVQSNAAGTEELSATAETLAGQAEELRLLVGQFRVGAEPAAAGLHGT
jgi:methyl-accepting chemotaxis protein